MVVIRSLVPGGVAQIDGRLVPGDRLISVNEILLVNATLSQAVDALKGAPKGVVRIGILKPLPIPEQDEPASKDTVTAFHPCIGNEYMPCQTCTSCLFIHSSIEEFEIEIN